MAAASTGERAVMAAAATGESAVALHLTEEFFTMHGTRAVETGISSATAHAMLTPTAWEAVHNSVQKDQKFLREHNKAFTTETTDLQRIREEQLACKGFELGPNAAFLLLEVPEAARCPFASIGARWTLNPSLLLDSAKAKAELERRLVDIDKDIDATSDAIGACNSELSKISRNKKKTFDEKEYSRMRRLRTNTENKKVMLNRLNTEKIALQDAVASAAECKPAKWVWKTADDVLDKTAIHSKFVVANNTGIFDCNGRRRALHARLMAVATIAVVDDLHESADESADDQRQLVIVTVTLMAHNKDTWLCAVPSENPPAGFVKISKDLWMQRNFDKVAMVVQEELNRQLLFVLAQLAFSSTSDAVGAKPLNYSVRPSVWKWWTWLAGTKKYQLSPTPTTMGVIAPLACDMTSKRVQSHFELLFIQRRPAEAGIYSLACFFRSKCNLSDSDATWCETLFRYKADKPENVIEESIVAAVKAAVAFYLSYRIASDTDVGVHVARAVGARPLSEDPDKDDVLANIAALGGKFAVSLPPPKLNVVIRDIDGQSEGVVEEGDVEGEDDSEDDDDDEADAEADADADADEEGSGGVTSADGVDHKKKKQMLIAALRKDTAEAICGWLSQDSPLPCAIFAEDLLAAGNEMAGVYVSYLRETDKFKASMVVGELTDSLKKIFNLARAQALQLSEEKVATFNLIVAMVDAGICVNVYGAKYKVVLAKNNEESRIKLVNIDDNQPCANPPRVRYTNEQSVPSETSITNAALNRPNGTFLLAVLKFLQSHGITASAQMHAVGSGEAAMALPAPVVDEEVLRAELAAEYKEKTRKLQDMLAKKEIEMEELRKRADANLDALASNPEVAKDGVCIARAWALVLRAVNVNEYGDASNEEDPALALFTLLKQHFGHTNVPAITAATPSVAAVVKVANVLKQVGSMTLAAACQRIASIIAMIYDPMGSSQMVYFTACKYADGDVCDKKVHKMSALTGSFFFVLFPNVFVDLFTPSDGFKLPYVAENIKTLISNCFVRPKGKLSAIIFRDLTGWVVMQGGTSKNANKAVTATSSGGGKHPVCAKFLLDGETLYNFMADGVEIENEMPLPELVFVNDENEAVKGLSEYVEHNVKAATASSSAMDEDMEEELLQPAAQAKRRPVTRSSFADDDDADEDLQEDNVAKRSKRGKRGQK